MITLVEERVDRTLQLHVGWTEEEWEVLLLLQANPMLTANHSTLSNTEQQHLLSNRMGALRLIGITRIVEHQRVQVAITGVEDVTDLHGVGMAQLLDLFEHEGEACPRYNCINKQVGRGKAPKGASKSLTCRPDPCLLLGCTSRTQLKGALGTTDRQDLFKCLIKALLYAINLYNEQGDPFPLRETEAVRPIDRTNPVMIHHLE